MRTHTTTKAITLEEVRRRTVTCMLAATLIMGITLGLIVTTAGRAAAVTSINGKYNASALCDGTYNMATLRVYQERINVTGWERLDVTLSAWSTTRRAWVLWSTITRAACWPRPLRPIGAGTPRWTSSVFPNSSLTTTCSG